MSEILNQLAICIERGKVNITSNFPADMRGQEGVEELTIKALELSFSPNEILQEGLMVGMKRIGDRFGDGKAFIPDMLVAAKAMNASLVHLKKYFDSGEIKHKGTVVIGTVSGDLHDIGKNIVRMVLKGDGWNVIDLGVDVKSEKFIETIEQYPNCYVGLSALLTTTMVNMKTTNNEIKAKFPNVKVFIGGAPISHEFNDEIGTDGYYRDPYKFAQYLTSITR